MPPEEPKTPVAHAKRGGGEPRSVAKGPGARPGHEARSPLVPRGAPGSTPDRGAGAGAIVALGSAVAVVAGVMWLISRSAEDPDAADLAPPPLPGEMPLSPSRAASASRPPPAPRCRPVVKDESFVVGEAPTQRADPPTDTPPGIPGLDAPGVEDEPGASPFAVVLGRGIATRDGFALGALRDGEGGSIASIVRLGSDGRDGRVIRLARSRGDVEAPVLAAAPDGALLVALLEPNAGGRALRLARVAGTEVTWGAELTQGRDESLALDLAASGARAVVAWDEADDDRSRIALASFPVGDIGSATAARVVSDDETDAESPRLVSRPGGFWLTYVARGGVAKRAALPEEAIDPVDEDEVDEEAGGERIAASWIEVMPLDELGAASGGAARVTPREGTVLGFDVAPGADGGALITWRDDASPTGGGGGTVRAAYVGPGGVGEARPLVDEDVDDGVPELLGFGSGSGWVAVSSLRGAHALARLDDRGTPLGPVANEPSLGHGEPVAAIADRVLLATFEGRAVRFRVVACADGAEATAPDPAKPPTGHER